MKNVDKTKNAYRKFKTSLSPIFSVWLLLGFAYCPAIRPTRSSYKGKLHGQQRARMEQRTTGMRAPQTRMRENERMSPILAAILSCRCRCQNGHGLCERTMAFLCASIETLCTVAGMEEEGLVPLDGSELMAETLDLEGNISQDQG